MILLPNLHRAVLPTAQGRTRMRPRSSARAIGAILTLAVLLAGNGAPIPAHAQDVGSPAGAGLAEPPIARPTVGMEATLTNILIEGPELMVAPESVSTGPLVVRITGVFPHGTAGFRYDFAYVGLEPGTFNLGDVLVLREGGAAPGEPPQLPVTIDAVLPPGPPGLLADWVPEPIPFLGGYRITLIAVGIAWVIGLAVILSRRGRKPGVESGAVESEPPLAERLRPLAERAIAGELDAAGKAELERLVLGFWREKLSLEGVEVREALRRIQDHDEAGALLRQIESWLHRPPRSVPTVDLAHSLKPYTEARAAGA